MVKPAEAIEKLKKEMKEYLDEASIEERSIRMTLERMGRKQVEDIEP